MKWFFLVLIITAIAYMSYNSWTAVRRQLSSNALEIQEGISAEVEVSSENIQDF